MQLSHFSPKKKKKISNPVHSGFLGTEGQPDVCVSCLALSFSSKVPVAVGALPPLLALCLGVGLAVPRLVTEWHSALSQPALTSGRAHPGEQLLLNPQPAVAASSQGVEKHFFVSLKS